METQGLRIALKSMGFKAIGKVRRNVNDFAYVTCIKGDGTAENIYFSKALSGEVVTGEKLSAKQLDELRFAHVENAAGEKRAKIVGGSDYTDL
ncbi:MAG TPA: hypothetical protein VJN02_07950 [Gammaproteobacteria bacterium]|nr:hypothetical protein [Gammaproteobacteria bacterium]